MSREERSSDYEILEEPRKITTGKHQLERYASCVITGVIIGIFYNGDFYGGYHRSFIAFYN